jgi:uncharacterized protein (DUF849 family)
MSWGGRCKCQQEQSDGPSLQDEVACPDGPMTKKPARNAFAGLIELSTISRDSTIRERCPGLSVGVSTAIWIEPDIALRLRQVQEWTVLPDFASVNFEEPGAAELCHALLARGIGVEAGLSQVAHVELLRQSGLAERCLRILIEPVEEETEAATWPLLETALRLGYETRIGLEDTLKRPDGSQTQGNTELIALAIQRAGELT